MCVPPYTVSFNRATAIQFLDDGNQGLMCNSTTGVMVPCTGNCEILGEGPPIISLLDPTNAYTGVQVTYFGVPSVGNDNVRGAAGGRAQFELGWPSWWMALPAQPPT